ncbi:TonB-dependent receptor [Parasphingorhabdus sp.]|uniref:TonB-dependent receptor n=1 Tax=Parasphingorhabdus sp. TaxID=2709688 RepID=UPI00326645EF
MKNFVSRRALTALYLAGGSALALSSPALAEEQISSDEALITVTGERIERSLLDTASSVAVFDSARLAEQAGSDRIEQILDIVANVQRGSGDLGVTIRGQDTTGVLIGANAFLGGTRPRATLRLDGRALNYNEFIYGLGPIWDVERIEVFRGPQTTTQGRNAIAGAIFVETKDPTFEFEGAARAIVGNYDTVQTSLALSGPLVEDQLAARISVDWREHESWMNYPDPDIFVGANREDDDFINVRAKLLFTPTAIPDLELLLTYAHLNANNPQSETADDPIEDRFQAVQNGAHWETKVDSLVLEANYSFSDAWQASVTGTYADSTSERFSRPGAGSSFVDADEYSIEGLLRFAPTNGKLSGLFGMSYFAADQDETSDLSAFLGFGDFVDSQRSFGIFGEATLDLTPALHLTVGARWQQDNQDREGALGPVSLDYDKTFDAFLPKAELAYDISEDVVIGVTARKGFNPGGTTISFVTGDIDEFGAETLWSYELFSRASLADGDLLLTGNVFYTDFTNAQRPLISTAAAANGTIVEYTEFANAPSAESYGLELEAVWKASPAVQFRASMGLQDSKITETLLAADPMLGKEFQRAPRFNVALGVHLNPIEPLTFDLGLRHNSSYYSDDANNPAFEIDGVTMIDAKAAYDFGPASTFVYLRNATNEDYKVWQFRPGNASLGDPREYGIGLEMTF